jgi:RNA polymerase sigma-70 factor (ECF subfamily)
MGGKPERAVDGLARAREAWTDFHVDSGAFVERLQNLGASPEHAADLYLAFACACGDSAAAFAFDRTCLTQVAGFVAKIDDSPQFADEVRQVLRERLLLGESPRILEYKGAGPLGAWLRVAALRTALNLKAAANRLKAPQDAEAPARHLGTPTESPEKQLIKEVSRRQFEAALRSAVKALAPDQRQILKQHLTQRLSIDKIAALHRVHRATAARWLQSVRAAIFEGTRDRLRQRLKLTDSEFESMAELVRSRIDISLRSQTGDP